MRAACFFLTAGVRRCGRAVWLPGCLLLLGAVCLPLASLRSATTQAVTYDAQGNLVTLISSASVSPVVIVAGPTGRLAQIGSNVSLSVVVLGTPPLTYQWRFNGANIPSASNPSAATSTLILNGLTAGSFGNYTVAVTNSAGTVVSGAAALQLDSVGDGIPDSYKLANFGANWQSNPAVSGADADPDGDGFTNAEEYADGTDPNSATSHFYRLTVTGNNVLVQPSAARYAPNAVVTITALSQGDQQFYRWSTLDLLTANAVPVVSTANPLVLTITTSYAVTPLYTSQPLAQSAQSPSFTYANYSARSETFLTQVDGKLLAGGTFDSVGGSYHGNLVRFNVNGSVDTTFNAYTDSTVVCLAQQSDGKLLVGGYFNYVNGVYHRGTARLNVDGTLDATYNSNDSTDNYVRTIIPRASDGKILVTGDFGNGSTPNRNGVARLNADGTLDNTFATGTGVNSGTVWAGVWLPNGQVVIGGEFTSFNGVAATRLVRLNADGSVDTSFVANASDTVYQIARRSDGDLLVGGYFATIDGQAHRGFARLSGVDGGYNAAVNQGAGLNDGNVGGSGLVIQADGKAVIGGNFSGYNGSTQRDVARINADGSLDTGYATGGVGVDNPVYGVGLDAAGNTLIGGPFNNVNGVVHLGLARLLASNGNLDGSFAANDSYFSRTYALLAQPNGAVIACGAFNVVNGAYRPYVARINADNSLDTSFNSGSGPNSEVAGAAVGPDGKVVIVGNFNTVNGLPNSAVARFNADGSLDTAFGPVLYTNGEAEAAAIQRDGKIVVGGYFTTFGNKTRYYLARLNADGTLDTSFYPVLDSAIETYGSIVIQPDAKILVAGNFSNLNGNPVGTLIRLNPDGSQDPNFFLQSPNNVAYALALQPDGKIVVGGAFNYLAGSNQTANRLMRLNADGTLDPSFHIGPNYGANGYIYSIALQSDGHILPYGNYGYVNNVSISDGLAQLNADGSLDASRGILPGTAPDNAVYAVAVLPDDSFVIGGLFAHVNGLTRPGFARLVTVPGLNAGTVSVSPAGPNFATGAAVTLSVTPVAASGTTISSVGFETSTDGVHFQYLTAAMASTGGAWTAAVSGLPPGVTYVRAVVVDAATEIAHSDATGPLYTPPAVNGGSQAVTGFVGSAFKFQASAAAGPLTGFNASGLPSWATASFDANLGVLTISGTPDLPGVSTITLLPVNAAGSGSATLTLTVYNRFFGWASRYFTQAELSNPAISGPLGDATGAGISNLLKYALGIAPKLPGIPAGLPVVSEQTYGGQQYLTLTYTHDKTATDVALAVQVSGDLQTWSTGTGYTVEVSRTDNGNGTETVVTHDALPMSGNARRFIRLQVTQISL